MNNVMEDRYKCNISVNLGGGVDGAVGGE